MCSVIAIVCMPVCPIGNAQKKAWENIRHIISYSFLSLDFLVGKVVGKLGASGCQNNIFIYHVAPGKFHCDLVRDKSEKGKLYLSDIMKRVLNS